MKKVCILVLATLLVLSIFSTAFAKVPSAEDFRKTKSIELKVAKTITVKTTCGTRVKLKKGTSVRGGKFALGEAYIKLPCGKFAYVSTKYLRTKKGCKIPKLPTEVRLTEKFRLEGEVLPAGIVLYPQYYAFSNKGFLMAFCVEGYVPVKYLEPVEY